MKIIWNRAGGLPECPYFRLWAVLFKKWSVRLHQWLGDDDHRHPHNHPYWFVTVVLRGGYDDVTYETIDNAVLVKDVERMRAGMIRFRPADHMHSVQNVRPNTWTFLITGAPMFRWGFLVKGKIIKRDKYFAVHGHHPCDGTGEGVRLKPDGTRISDA
jgi:hypothetical protein